jgi:hypothetical protein
VADQATKQDNLPVSQPDPLDAPDEISTGVITMSSKKILSPADQKRLEEFLERFHRDLAKQPTMSDEEFMADTEASDEQYGLGLVLPGVGNDREDKDE